MPKYKRLQRLLYHPCSYTANTSKQHTELYMGFSCDYTRSTDHDTRPAQAVIIPLAQSWSVSQRRSTSSTYQIPATRRTLYRPAQPRYYNNVYKGAAVCHCYGSMPNGAAYRRPCEPGGVSMLPTPGGLQSGTGQQSARHPPPGGAVQQQRARRATRNHWRLVAASFFGLSPDSQ